MYFENKGKNLLEGKILPEVGFEKIEGPLKYRV